MFALAKSNNIKGMELLLNERADFSSRDNCNHII